MSAEREWKPGSAAVVECHEATCPFREHKALLGKSGRWYLLEIGEYWGGSRRRAPAPARRDRPRGPRTGQGTGEGAEFSRARVFCHVDDIAAALRSLGEPPKPEEPPTDPKALVSDRRDNIWRLLADGDWVCTSGPDIGEYLTWDRLVSERGPVEAAQ